MSRVHVAVIGAAGMIGRKLVARLARDGRLDDDTELGQLSLVDLVEPEASAGGDGAADCWAADLAAPGAAERLLAGRPDVIFHLAAVVSGEAEADFDHGYRVNLDGTRALLRGHPPRAHNRRVPPAAGVLLLDRGVRRAAARRHAGGLRGRTADQLRHAEGHR